MSTEMAREQAQGTADTLAEIERDGWPNGEGIYEWLEGVLDVKRTYTQVTHGRRAEENRLTEVSLLVAFGGPTTWVTFDGRGAEVASSWWSDEVRVWVPCPSLSAEVIEAMDY
jgi:hypothetical protein